MKANIAVDEIPGQIIPATQCPTRRGILNISQGFSVHREPLQTNKIGETYFDLIAEFEETRILCGETVALPQPRSVLDRPTNPLNQLLKAIAVITYAITSSSCSIDSRPNLVLSASFSASVPCAQTLSI